jgi:hypothetical protein
VQSRGVGTQLLTEVELTGAAAGCRVAFVVCRTGSPSEGWYLARGWRHELPLPHWRHGHAFVRLTRELAR